LLGNLVPKLGQQSREQRRIALPDLTRPSVRARRHQFIAADQQTQPWLRVHHQLLHSAARQSAQVRHPEPDAGRHQLLTGGRLFLRAADPGVRAAGLDQLDRGVPVLLLVHQFLRQHPLTALWHDGPGEDPHRFTGRQNTRKRRPRR
jgi:hypothetical protein